MTSAHNSITNLQGHLLNENPHTPFFSFLFFYITLYILLNKLCTFEGKIKKKKMGMTFITNNLFLTIICCLNEPGEHCTTLYIPNHPLVIEIVGGGGVRAHARVCVCVRARAHVCVRARECVGGWVCVCVCVCLSLSLATFRWKRCPVADHQP